MITIVQNFNSLITSKLFGLFETNSELLKHRYKCEYLCTKPIFRDLKLLQIYLLQPSSSVSLYHNWCILALTLLIPS